VASISYEKEMDGTKFVIPSSSSFFTFNVKDENGDLVKFGSKYWVSFMIKTKNVEIENDCR